MDDLVKRLRDANTNHIDADLWMMEAADRIEELEAKLAKLRTFLDELWDSQGYDARELHDLLNELDDE